VSAFFGGCGKISVIFFVPKTRLKNAIKKRELKKN
jgi:hypothetical protein